MKILKHLSGGLVALVAVGQTASHAHVLTDDAASMGESGRAVAGLAAPGEEGAQDGTLSFDDLQSVFAGRGKFSGSSDRPVPGDAPAMFQGALGGQLDLVSIDLS